MDDQGGVGEHGNQIALPAIGDANGLSLANILQCLGKMRFEFPNRECLLSKESLS